jgi:lipoprotein-anchoring transpeptidase ErfK/SrfK
VAPGARHHPHDPVRARDVLNRALHNGAVSEAERVELRKRLSEIAEMVTFSSRVFPGDPMADTYVIASGDRLSKIPAREGFRTDYRLLQRLNGIKDANTIRVGQKLKALYGPFHAVVDKSDFRMDIFADQKDTAGNPVFVTSFRVGLGEMGSTPIGSWKVRTNSKLIDPKWVNPRTGEVFQASDPKNPIGERWIGLIGTDSQTSLLEGYGIHGTIDPASIGREMSMGCVRLADNDVEVVYELLIDDLSTVRIVP